jgi:hypothetical protein
MSKTISILNQCIYSFQLIKSRHRYHHLKTVQKFVTDTTTIKQRIRFSATTNRRNLLTSGGMESITFFNVTSSGTGSPICVNPYSSARRCLSPASSSGDDGGAIGAATAEIGRLAPVRTTPALRALEISNCQMTSSYELGVIKRNTPLPLRRRSRRLSTKDLSKSSEAQSSGWARCCPRKMGSIL